MNVKLTRDNHGLLKENFHNYDRNFNAPRIIKPKPGLSLTELDNIPKFIRNKQNITNVSNYNTSNPVTKISNSKIIHNKSFDKNTSQDSRNGRKLEKNFSNSYLTIKSSRERMKSNPKNVGKSPVGNLHKTSRCHRYHTDLDFNYLTGEKFMKDSISCGREKLQGVALKNSSPEKYYYDSRVKNDFDRNLNWIKNINPSNISHSEDKNDDTLKISNIDNDYLDESKQFIKKSSKGILSDVLDNRFSVNSPSKMKKYQDELLQAKTEEYKKGLLKSMQKGDQGEGTTNEEDKRKKNVKNVQASSQPNKSPETKNKIYVEDEKNARLTVNLSYFGEDPSERYIMALQNLLSQIDPVFENLSILQKIEKLLTLLDDSRRITRLGALVALYVILKKYEIEENIKQIILEKTLDLLRNYENQEELFLVACHEICSLYSKHEILLGNVNLICMFLTDFNFPLLQKSAFNCLISMEYVGIKALVELASKDLKDYQQYILTNLLNTPHIQKIIIIRALLNEVYSNIPERRHSALAALNRLHDLISDNETLVALSKFFNDHRIEKIFLSSTLRTSGIKGEKILLNEIKNNKDYSVRVAIASVLDYRLPKYPIYLKMKLDKNDAYSLSKNIPGKFCTYYGKVSPLVHELNSDSGYLNESEEEFLEVSTRDFLASLQRMVAMNYDHSYPQIVHRGSPFWLDSLNLRQYVQENLSDNSKQVEDPLNKYLGFFELTENDERHNMNRNLNLTYNIYSELNERGQYLISEEVIKALCFCLKDYSTAVRDTAAGTLGRIGLPEGLLSIDYLIDYIKDEDVNVKSKIIWTIGRIAPGCDNSVIPYIVDALKSNMWKVKCACFYALSQFGSRSAKQAVPSLLKLLKESAINKQTIAETLVKLGSEGENTLINIMNTESDSNYKLKAVIAKSLGLSNVNSPNIDFIVECLFNSAKSNLSLIRQNSLFAIRVLAEKAEEKVTYLKRKNLIPFYYEMMTDKEQSIQAVLLYILYNHM